MKNWKTTLVGAASAVCFLGFKLLTKTPISGDDVIVALGLLGLGRFAKDEVKPKP